VGVSEESGKREQQPDDEWFNAEIEAGDALPVAGAQVLESAAETLRGAPDGKRYDIKLTVEEQ
jgi:hypothetical protein